MNLSRFQRSSDPIGSGTFATLYKAFDTQEKIDVCLKVIHPHILEQCEEYVLLEVEILKKLKHPNVVEYYGHFCENERFYCVIEFAEGGDLETFMNTNNLPLPEETVLLFLEQLISVIQYVHEHKIVHRDLKPENIILTKENKIKICGFTSAKMFETDDFFASTKVGTPRYMAPEIVKEERHSFPVDIWSLGCIAYELMTGRYPFSQSNTIGLEEMILTINPNPIQGNYSPKLSETVMEMLEKDPEKRITLKEIQAKLLN
jgi:NIMA (never in mitosis gene a)-related kinase